MNGKEKPKDIVIINKPEEQCVIIEGVRYHYTWFRMMGATGLPIGAVFRMKNRREDGSVELERLEMKRIVTPKLFIPGRGGKPN